MNNHDYHQTTELSDADLKRFIFAAQRQNDVVLQVYRTKDKPMTAYQSYEYYSKLGGSMLFTSWRRSITNLFNKGELKKYDMIREKHGSPNYRYLINC